MARVPGKTNHRAELARLSDPALRAALIDLLRAYVADSARRRPDEIGLDQVYPEPGLLFSAVRPHILRDLGFSLVPYDLPHCRSLAALAAHLAGEVRMPPAPGSAMGELYQPGWSEAVASDSRSDPPLEKPIVFVLSPPRSGSTLLAAMLGRHPRLYAAGELTLLPFPSMGARRRWLGSERAWLRIGLIAALQELTGMTAAQAEEACRTLEDEDIAVAEVYRRLQELAGNRLVVDKSPAYSAEPAWLARAERVFRAPRYIHLIRHPGAVIESFVRMRIHRLMGRDGPVWDENPWLFAEKVWTSHHRHCLRFLEGVEPARRLRVSYEALVADPAAVLALICDFLQIPFDAAPLQPYAGGKLRVLGMGDMGFLKHSGIDARLASDWESAEPPQSFGRLTRDVAADLGYELG